VAAISGAVLDSLGTATPSSPKVVSAVYLLSSGTRTILAPG